MHLLLWIVPQTVLQYLLAVPQHFLVVLQYLLAALPQFPQQEFPKELLPVFAL